MIDQSNRTAGGNIMGGPAYSPDAASMSYMIDRSQQFNPLSGVDTAAAAAGMSLASHAAMTNAAAMGAYQAASAQHLSQYGAVSQQQHAAMLGLPGAGAAPPHMMGGLPPPPPDYYG